MNGIEPVAADGRRAFKAAVLLAAALAAAPDFAPLARAQVRSAAVDPRTAAAQMEPLWNEWGELVKARPWGATHWARGTYLGLRLFGFGAAGVPFAGSRFARTASPEEAFLAGVFMASCGGDTERRFIRGQLETNPLKRQWLQASCGTGVALSNAVEEGEDWQAAARALPSPAGCRALTLECMASADPLVRRAGMLWGYWLADANYWTALKRAAERDADSLTRRFAAFLVNRAASQL